MSNSVLLQGDCLEMLKQLPDNSVDSLVTDPPAGISFMGKSWDEDKGGRKQWIKWMSDVMTECLRVLKPGAHGLVWAIPRTSHWTATALEDAGFEIRDVVTHHFGSGFPKSLNTTKQIEKGFECLYLENVSLVEHQSVLIPVESNGERIGFVAVNVQTLPGEGLESRMVTGVVVSSPEVTGMLLYASTELTDSSMTLLSKSILEDDFYQKKKSITLTKLKTIIDLKIWNLLPHQSTLKNTIALNGTSLKPASEHWILVRKPCSEKTVAANVLKHGTGGINIDASRVAGSFESGWSKSGSKAGPNLSMSGANTERAPKPDNPQGRFPANLVFSHNPDCMEVGTKKVKTGTTNSRNSTGIFDPGLAEKKTNTWVNKEDGTETVSAFECTPFCAVAELDRQSGVSKSQGGSRGAGGQHGAYSNIAAQPDFKPGLGDSGGASRFFYVAKASKKDKGADNTHPTVKSQALMSYLINMITPPDGIVLDPFMGSGTTGVAAIKNGFAFIGIEKETEYYTISEKRIQGATTNGTTIDSDQDSESA